MAQPGKKKKEKKKKTFGWELQNSRLCKSSCSILSWCPSCVLQCFVSYLLSQSHLLQV